MASALRQRAYNIYMDVAEPVIWDREKSGTGLNCWRLLGDLARMASPNKICDISSHAWPVVFSGCSLDGFFD